MLKPDPIMTSKVQLNDFQENDAKYICFSLIYDKENLEHYIDSLKKRNFRLNFNNQQSIKKDTDNIFYESLYLKTTDIDFQVCGANA